jgi:hypothetical protein
LIKCIDSKQSSFQIKNELFKDESILELLPVPLKKQLTFVDKGGKRKELIEKAYDEIMQI